MPWIVSNLKFKIQAKCPATCKWPSQRLSPAPKIIAQFKGFLGSDIVRIYCDSHIKESLRSMKSELCGIMSLQVSVEVFRENYDIKYCVVGVFGRHLAPPGVKSGRKGQKVYWKLIRGIKPKSFLRDFQGRIF